jgi:hypothetical protein
MLSSEEKNKACIVLRSLVMALRNGLPYQVADEDLTLLYQVASDIRSTPLTLSDDPNIMRRLDKTGSDNISTMDELNRQQDLLLREVAKEHDLNPKNFSDLCLIYEFAQKKNPKLFSSKTFFDLQKVGMAEQERKRQGEN